MNLYLYLPPHSAHSPGVLQGTIHSMIRSIDQLTTDLKKRDRHISLFLHRLLARGHKYSKIAPIFHESLKRLQQKKTKAITTQMTNLGTELPRIRCYSSTSLITHVISLPVPSKDCTNIQYDPLLKRRTFPNYGPLTTHPLVLNGLQSHTTNHGTFEATSFLKNSTNAGTTKNSDGFPLFFPRTFTLIDWIPTAHMPK